MFMNVMRRVTLFNAVTLFSIAVTASTIWVYCIFDLYLISIGTELMKSWIRSEAVEIQEGNLLTSITKNQRVLLSSQFVKGVALFDDSTKPPMRLIEFGEKIEPVFKTPGNSEKIEIVRAGFFSKKGLYKIPNKPDLLLVFAFDSSILRQFFFITVTILLLFIIILFGSIKIVQSREFRKREEYLRRALGDLVEQDKASDFVEENLPFLVQWWKQKKRESEHAKQLAIENESKILLGELAARVAHDIRSPLNTINAVTSDLQNIPEDKRRLLKGGIQRIRDIANGIVDQNNEILAKERLLSASDAVFPGKTEVSLLFSVLETIVTEKRTQHPGKEISLDISPTGYCLFAKIHELELKRTLSNLIENAVEATSAKGLVQVALSEVCGQIVIEIKDNGCGISPDFLHRIGEKGFSVGKENGSGLGVFYAKEAVKRWGGGLEISSQFGLGTSVEIKLKKESPPSWYAEDVRISKTGTVIIIDDDPTVHGVWRERIGSMAEDINVEHFFEPQSAISWFARNRNDLSKYVVLTDFDLKVPGSNGLEIIRSMNIEGKKALLVTSAYSDHHIQTSCNMLGVKVLPKPSLTYTPIVWE